MSGEVSRVQPANDLREKKKMSPYSQAHHLEGPNKAPDAPNAALLIDFDNVTMGMRSDLSKELKSLLASDVIRGKVTVQRAYADWRRYPQYIVPLSEASVDLIFAPAYGSSKKNATDIRMAIDGMELVFIRPEIGTYILLTGDSDFSSLVLKLKEYGKYVIGVGIEESSSDILVQNCNEYYSYTSLTGLRKTTEIGGKTDDPWDLVEKAVGRMTTRGDVMRSDRLKQVMLELDNRFSEGNFGFSKFSKFVAEASSRGLVRLHKLENGQYEIRPGSGRTSGDIEPAPREPRARSRAPARRGRSTKVQRDESTEGGESKEPERVQAKEPERLEAKEPELVEAKEPERLEARATGEGSSAEMQVGPELRAAYDLMARCLQNLGGAGKDSTRDSDVKRKMLEADRSFDEGELGFGKFSRFLLQAEAHRVVSLEKTEMGNYRVSLVEPREGSETSAEGPSDESASKPTAPATAPSTGAASTRSGGDFGRRLGPRGGSGGRKESDGPVLFEGQIVGNAAGTPTAATVVGRIDIGGLGLPTSESAIVSYLTNYGGVGKKTAESLVEAFGVDIFTVFESDPSRVAAIVPRRALQVLAEWKADLSRRSQKSRSQREVAPEVQRAPEADSVPERDVGPGRDGRPTLAAEVESATVPIEELVEEPIAVGSGSDAGSETKSESPSLSGPTPRSGGARRRTRRGPRPSPSSGTDT
jgi:uncharacterized protein (TIGR00288 family)